MSTSGSTPDDDDVVGPEPLTRREMKARGIPLTVPSDVETGPTGMPWQSGAPEAGEESDSGPVTGQGLDAEQAESEPASGTDGQDVEDDTSTGRRPVVVAPLTARGIRTIDETGAITAVQAAVGRAVEAATSPASWHSAVSLPAIALGITDVAEAASADAEGRPTGSGGVGSLRDGGASGEAGGVVTGADEVLTGADEAVTGEVEVVSGEVDEASRGVVDGVASGVAKGAAPGDADRVTPADVDRVTPADVDGVAPGVVDADEGAARRETIGAGPRPGVSATPTFEAAPAAATAESHMTLGSHEAAAADVPETVADDVERAKLAGGAGVAGVTGRVEAPVGHTEAAASVPETVADDVDRAERASHSGDSEPGASEAGASESRDSESRASESRASESRASEPGASESRAPEPGAAPNGRGVPVRPVVVVAAVIALIVLIWLIAGGALSSLFAQPPAAAGAATGGVAVATLSPLMRGVRRGARADVAAGSMTERVWSPPNRVSSPADRVSSPADRVSSPPDRAWSPADRASSPADPAPLPTHRGAS